MHILLSHSYCVYSTKLQSLLYFNDAEYKP